MSSTDRQLMFCHECQNEWYKAQHGIFCPECHSEFTEEIEEANDPRADAQLPADTFDYDDPPLSIPEHEHPLRDHYPFRDPDDDGPEFFGRGGEQEAFRSGPYTQVFGIGRNGGRMRPEELGDQYARLLQQVMRPQAGQQMPQNAMGGGFNPWGGPARAVPQASGNQGAPGGVRFTVRSTTFGVGPGGVEHRSQTWSNTDGPEPDLHSMFVDVFNRVLGAQARANAGPGAANEPPQSLAQLFAPFFDPARAQHGDAVFTNEALDRVISQLMEQNSMGSAPPPASQHDIATLPKVPITADMQDTKSGSADCSICMESVPVGEEVTRLYCGHWFHGDCVGAWLREHDSCPQCRKGVAEARAEAMGESAPASAPTSPRPGPTAGPGNLGRGFSFPSTSRRGRPARQTTSGRPASSTEMFTSGGTSSGWPSTMPGSWGTEPSRQQSGLSQTSSRGQQGRRQSQQSQDQPQGFADRLRGLFGGRGGGS